MEFDDVILGRRSIRGYKPDPVPQELIKEILALAIRAPSSMNTQPWNFYVITGAPLHRIRQERGLVAGAWCRDQQPGDHAIPRGAGACRDRGRSGDHEKYRVGLTGSQFSCQCRGI